MILKFPFPQSCINTDIKVRITSSNFFISIYRDTTSVYEILLSLFLKSNLRLVYSRDFVIKYGENYFSGTTVFKCYHTYDL